MVDSNINSKAKLYLEDLSKKIVNFDNDESYHFFGEIASSLDKMSFNIANDDKALFIRYLGYEFLNIKIAFKKYSSDDHNFNQKHKTISNKLFSLDIDESIFFFNKLRTNYEQIAKENPHKKEYEKLYNYFSEIMGKIKYNSIN